MIGWQLLTSIIAGLDFYGRNCSYFCSISSKIPIEYAGRTFSNEAERPQVYGETPITTLAYLAKHLRIQADDQVLELGCGRGRLVFWLHFILGCRVTGADCVPAFIRTARRIGRLCGASGVQWLCDDLMNASLQGYTWIFLYGTTLGDETLYHWVEARLHELDAGAVIVTVSYSLLDYGASPYLILIDMVTVPFVWGEAEVYIHRRR